MPTIASLEGDSMPLKWNPLGLGNLVLFGVFFFPQQCFRGPSRHQSTLLCGFLGLRFYCF